MRHGAICPVMGAARIKTRAGKKWNLRYSLQTPCYTNRIESEMNTEKFQLSLSNFLRSYQIPQYFYSAILGMNHTSFGFLAWQFGSVDWLVMVGGVIPFTNYMAAMWCDMRPKFTANISARLNAESNDQIEPPDGPRGEPMMRWTAIYLTNMTNSYGRITLVKIGILHNCCGVEHEFSTASSAQL